MLSRFSLVQLFATLWTVACQAPLSVEFLRQEYWSELPFPPPGDLPHPRIEPVSLTSSALAGGSFTAPDTREGLTSLLSAAAVAAAAKSCRVQILCDPVDGSPSGSPVLGILQTRTLRWVAISFSNA